MWGFSLPFHGGKAPSAVRLLVCEHTQGSPGFMCLCAHPHAPCPVPEPPGRFCKHRLSEPSLSGQHRALFHPLTVFPISLFKYRQLCMGMLLLTMKPVISTTKFPLHPAPPPHPWRCKYLPDPSDEGPRGHPVLSLRQCFLWCSGQGTESMAQLRWEVPGTKIYRKAGNGRRLYVLPP